MLRVADYIIQRLYDEGCAHVFMVTGRGLLFLTDAVARHGSIKGISVHHEQSASFAAIAYAQKTNNIGACLVSTGCASTNAVTGVLNAWQDNVPCVFISGQNKLAETVRHTGLPIRTYGQQEADIVSIVKPVTKYAVMLQNPNNIAYEMDKALFLASTGRKGPVWIDVPLDIQNMRVDPNSLPRFVPDKNINSVKSSDVKYVLDKLYEAKRPAILIGSGVRASGAIELLQKLVKESNIPVVHAPSAVDVLDANTPNAVGTPGVMAANRAANFVVQNSDFILVLGCRLSSMIVGDNAKNFAREAKIVMVDIDPNESKKYPDKIDLQITADIFAFLSSLLKERLRKAPDQWTGKCAHWKSIFPRCEQIYKGKDMVDIYELADVLSDILPIDATCLSDAGLEELIIPTTIRFRQGQRCIHPVSQGTMGFALPASIGVYFAGGKQIVAIIGDGSVMMNLQELQTIYYYKIPVKIIIVNNNCYAVIRNRQLELFRERVIGTDPANGISCPDFAKVASCFGLGYIKISSSGELYQGLKETLAMEGPVICEIISNNNQSYIHNSYRRNSAGKFVQPPMEDQSPFLDRELFLSEMIIDPVDNT